VCFFVHNEHSYAFKPIIGTIEFTYGKNVVKTYTQSGFDFNDLDLAAVVNV